MEVVMEDEHSELESSGIAKTVLDVDVYLRNRDEPLRARMTMRFDTEDLPGDIEELTDSYVAALMGAMRVVGQMVFVMEDEHHHQMVIRLDDVQAFDVRAPAQLPESLQSGTEESNE